MVAPLLLMQPNHSENSHGGGACESNTPRTLFTPHVGFEDREAHQDPFASRAVLWAAEVGLSNWRGPYVRKLSPATHR